MTFAAALAAIMAGSPGVVAVALGVLMLLERPACPTVWSVPALLLSALFPAHGLFLPALLPVLFWPAIVGRDGGLGATSDAMAVKAVIGTALVWHMPASGVPECLVASGVGVLFVVGRAILQGCAPGDPGLVRPLMLMALVVAARDQDLTGSARVALEAVFLDLTLRTVLHPLAVRFAVSGILRLPVPPLPGFVVLWLGIHAALGMAAGLDGWSLLGTAIAVLLGLLALCDVSAVAGDFTRGRAAPKAREAEIPYLLVGVASLLMPALVFGAVSPALRFAGGGWDWPVWRLGGGDGAFLRLMPLWLCGAGIWGAIVRPWRVAGGIGSLAAALDGSVRGVLTHVATLPGEPPALGWTVRRVIVGVRRRARVFAALPGPVLPDLRHGAVGVWLVLLGMALAVLGVMS